MMTRKEVIESLLFRVNSKTEGSAELTKGENLVAYLLDVLWDPTWE